MPQPKDKKGNPIIPVVCLWGHLCTLSSLDKDRNNLSLFNIIEQFNIPQGAFDEHIKTKGIILIPHEYEIVLHWVRTVDIDGINDKLNFDFSLKFVDPSNKVIQETSASLTFPDEKKGLHFRLRTNAVAITTSGNYKYEVELKRVGKEEFNQVVRTILVPIKVAQSLG